MGLGLVLEFSPGTVGGLPLSLESVFISRRVPVMLGIRMRFGVSPMKQDVSEKLGNQDVIGIWCICVAIHL